MNFCTKISLFCLPLKLNSISKLSVWYTMNSINNFANSKIKISEIIKHILPQ